MNRAGEVTQRAPLLPFARIGPCRLIRPLGSGATGAVYLAELEQHRPYAPCGTNVALKLLHPTLRFDPDTRRRFRREARIGLALRHPSIVTTYEATLEDTEQPHLILEYIDGRDLRSLMRDLVRLPEAMLRDLGAAIARGLEAIHASGALHRDLKPTNLLLTRDHQVKIADLGAAHLVDPGSMSKTHGFLGTPLYASPEQLEGGRLSPASDLYSLGVVLYEAATGVQPFAGRDVHAIVRRHAEHVPARAGQLNLHLSEFCEELLSSLLDKDPGRRPADALDLATTLELGEESPWWRSRQQQARTFTPRGALRHVHVEMASPLVGRERELTQLAAWYDEAKLHGGRVVILEGEAGVGKSRLVAELIAAIADRGDDTRVLYGSNPPISAGGGTGAVTQAVLDHFGREQLATALRRHLGATPQLVRPFAAHLTGDVAEGDAPLSGEVLHTLFSNLVVSLAAEQPLVWIVDDLHFARADARALLLSLARATQHERALLIATNRPGAASEELAAILRLPNARGLRLDRLDGADVIAIVSAAASPTVAERIGRSVARKSDGNPFFALALTRELCDAGPERPAEASDLPSSVREFLGARLGGLDAEERALLDAAAVQGFAFDPDLVARVLERKRLAVLQSLATIERRLGLIRATGSGFEFDHHMLQELLYVSLPPMLRCEYHELVARAAEAKLGPLADPDHIAGDSAVLLAEHYSRGGQNQAARPFVLPALRHLRQRFRDEEALELAARVTSPLPEDLLLLCDIRLVQAQALTHLGRSREGLDLAREAIRLASEAGDTRRGVEAGLALGMLCYLVSDLEGSKVALLAALAVARSHGDRDGEARCARKVGLNFLALADFDEAMVHFDNAIAITSDIGDRSGHAESLRSRARVPLLTGRYAEAEPLLVESLRICREVGDRMGEANSLSALGVMHTRLGADREALDCFTPQRAIAIAIGHRSGEAHAESQLAAASIRLGDYDEARACLTRGLRLADSMGDRLLDATTRHNLGALELHLGNLGAARAASTHSLESLRGMGERRFEADAIIEIAIVDRSEGRLTEARNRLDEARSLATLRKLATDAARATFELGNTAFAGDDRARAACLYEEAMAAMRALGERSSLASALVARARLHYLGGDADSARALFTEAREVAAHANANVGLLPDVYLDAIASRPIDRVVGDRARIDVRAETHAMLYRTLGDATHRDRAEALLEHMSRHLLGGARECFFRAQPIARMLRGE